MSRLSHMWNLNCPRSNGWVCVTVCLSIIHPARAPVAVAIKLRPLFVDFVYIQDKVSQPLKKNNPKKTQLRTKKCITTAKEREQNLYIFARPCCCKDASDHSDKPWWAKATRAPVDICAVWTINGNSKKKGIWTRAVTKNKKEFAAYLKY